jgi:60 kDa SS-A/Ro ribonucleoprotein
MTTYTKPYSRLQTRQTEAIPGSGQVKNSAGGYSFQLPIWQVLNRFLILGAEGATYYSDERKMQRENTGNLSACIKEDGVRAVGIIREISLAGRAPKNDPAIFALALAVVEGDEETRAAAYRAVSDVCRTGTHLFQFEKDLKELGRNSASSGMKSCYRRWLTELPIDKLALQLIKYRQREGDSRYWKVTDHSRLLYSHRPRLDPERAELLRWPLIRRQGENPRSKYFGKVEFPHPLIEGFERLQAESDPKRAAGLIREFELPREAVPTELLNSPEVWSALLERMPMTALIRNLATMTRVGILGPLSDGTVRVVDELGNADRIRKARVHPIAILMALKTYAQGHGDRGKHTWAPVPQIIDALDEAFYTAFDNVEPTNTNWLLGLDVSGSMSMGRVGGVNLTPAEAVAALSLVTAKVERKSQIFGFASTFRDLGISARMRLDQVLDRTSRMTFGGTDCALPMIYAEENRLPVDTFLVLTDNETWAGSIHPTQALDRYNHRMGRKARLVVVGMTSTGFSIADPNRNDMLDVVGFDSAVPTLIREFALALN